MFSVTHLSPAGKPHTPAHAAKLRRARQKLAPRTKHANATVAVLHWLNSARNLSTDPLHATDRGPARAGQARRYALDISNKYEVRVQGKNRACITRIVAGHLRQARSQGTGTGLSLVQNAAPQVVAHRNRRLMLVSPAIDWRVRLSRPSSPSLAHASPASPASSPARSIRECRASPNAETRPSSRARTHAP